MERDLYTEEHEMFREAYRTFIEREMVPHREKWEADGIVDRDLFLQSGCQRLPGHGGSGGVRGLRHQGLPLQQRDPPGAVRRTTSTPTGSA